jgi:hypothetical protein
MHVCTYIYIYIYIVTHMPITRQRLGKRIPEAYALTVEGHPVLCNGQ